MENYFKNTLIEPQFSFINSRQDIQLDNLPIISANMDTITDGWMANTMGKLKAFGCLHRFWSIQENINELKKVTQPIKYASIGLGAAELDRAKALYDSGATHLVLDVAHGAQISVVKQIKELQQLTRHSNIIVGNFATSKTIDDFKYHLGNKNVFGWKIGIGNGCFAAGTRILMANGTYKNIEQISIHDKVINKDGKVVEVIGTKFSGYKKVNKYKNNNFYLNTFCTPDHQHWVGDLSKIKTPFKNGGLSKVLDKKTKKKESKFKWSQISDINNSVLLMPKHIQFELPVTFKHNMSQYYQSRRSFSGRKKINDLIPSYELGYLLGTFLGDGHSSGLCSFKERPETYKTSSARTYWYFGLNEQNVALKVSLFLQQVFGVKCKIQIQKNIIVVKNSNNFIARFFEQFGKKQNKKLSDNLLCDNKEYLMGLFEGLIDSDGHYGKDGRIQFGNTSGFLIELFMFLHKKIKGYYPSVSTRIPTTGNLKNINIKNCKELYSCRSVKQSDKQLTNDYQIIRIYNTEKYDIEVPTYDIEVDCPTHSFIANNAIVHNSFCTTRYKTGVGNFQLQAIEECRVFHKEIIIADGGVKTPGDIAIALAAGADYVMTGSMFAGAAETPGEIVYVDNNPMKKYRGSASKESYEVQGKASVWRTPEGISSLVPYKGPVGDILKDIEGGLRSSFSYVGATNLKEFKIKANLIYRK